MAEQLGRTYGHVLTDVTYIQALSCIGRLRLGAVKEVEELAAPYVDGRRDSLGKPDSTLLAGHLLFAALYERTGNRAYLERVIAAANLGFAADGAPQSSMPYHNEMSDSVFMGCPILGQAARLTGEARYATMAVRHLRFMQGLCRRQDGLYRHSPLCDAAWGRGNAFPALGMALLLEALPAPHPHVLESFRSLLRALQPYQDADGLWHQVIDRPDSYAEFSSTAMIAAATIKGIRGGWIERGVYEPVVQQAWVAIQRRTTADGTVLDVCESTGKQKSMESYLNRAAIWDKDPRGGAMAMLLATEMMQIPRRG
jgi:rhamnogalacturonyl hydrolase YesR